jgi:uncharacterized protein YndB with AHSA1/START domain
MIDFMIELEIARSPSEVFAYVTDPRKLATWQTNTVSAIAEPDGPLRLGTRIREVHRGPRGKQVASLVEVCELEPDRLFSLRMIEGPLPVDGSISLEASEQGTRMRFAVHGEPRGPLRFLQPLMRAALKRQFGEHCATLKRVLERPATGSPLLNSPVRRRGSASVRPAPAGAREGAPTPSRQWRS